MRSRKSMQAHFSINCLPWNFLNHLWHSWNWLCWKRGDWIKKSIGLSDMELTVFLYSELTNFLALGWKLKFSLLLWFLRRILTLNLMQQWWQQNFFLLLPTPFFLFRQWGLQEESFVFDHLFLFGSLSITTSF